MYRTRYLSLSLDFRLTVTIERTPAIFYEDIRALTGLLPRVRVQCCFFYIFFLPETLMDLLLLHNGHTHFYTLCNNIASQERDGKDAFHYIISSEYSSFSLFVSP